MKFFAIILSFVLLFVVDTISRDTLSYQSKELIVIDSSNYSINKFDGLQYKTITFSKQSGLQITDVLKSIPSININQYGGVGSLTTFSIRGTSSNQSIISINQVPLNNSANPFFDINLLPTDIFDNINIVEIGNSARYGSGSIGGIIDFEVDNVQSTELSSYLSIGSYGLSKISINQKNIIPYFSNIANTLSYETYEGNYPISFNQFGKTIDTFRTNSAYKSLKLSNIMSFDFTKNFKLNSISFFSHNYQEQPGAVLVGRLEDENSFLKQINLISINSFFYRLSSSFLFITNSLSLKELNYNSSEFVVNKNTQFTSFDFANSLKYDFEYKVNNRINFELGMNYNQLVGNMLQKEVGKFIRRHIFYFNLSTNGIIRYIPLFYTASARVDKINHSNDFNFSWIVTTNYFVTENAKLNFTLSNNYRFPSFDEMYYFNYGNIDLLPEKSTSSEISLDYSYDFMNFQIVGFVNDVKDKIVSIPKSTLAWSAQNFSRVLNYGGTLSTSLSLIDNIFVIRYNHLLQTSFDNNPNSKYYKSLIPYIPNEKISLYLEINYDEFNLNVIINRNSYRYILPENNFENILPSHLLISASLKYETNLTKSIPVSLALAINNLTNLNYELIKNYPMPGRSITFTFGAKYENTNK